MDELTSAFMFLTIVNEALGYTHEETLNSSYVLVLSMLREHSFTVNKRNKEMYGSDGKEDEGEYVETVDYTTGKTKRVKKVNSF